MKQHKTALPSLFSVKNAVTFYNIKFGKKYYGGEWHDFPEMLYVERGRHQVLVDGELFEIEAGQAIIYAPNAYHVGSGVPSTAVVDIMSFETDMEELPTLCNRVMTLNDAQKRLFSAILTQGLELFLTIPKGSDARGLSVIAGVSEFELAKLKKRIELFLLELYTDTESETGFSSASNKANSLSDELKTMRKYLRENLDRVLTQDEIASHCSLSVSKLKRLCREQLGCGPITYFMSLKLGEAKKLISNSPKNFSEIAEELGFNSIHHFSRFFKEKTGLTPSEYARSVYKK